MAKAPDYFATSRRRVGCMGVMKTPKLLLAILAAPAFAFAQAPGAMDGPPDPPPPGAPMREKMRDKMRDRMMDGLSPELRQRFETVREKVMQDPKIQELRKKADAASEEFRNAMREAMIKADPELAEAIKENARRGGKRGDDRGPGLANLSEGDRQKLMAARETAKADPAVVAAEQKKEAARTPEERRAAGEEFHKAMRDALLKADPTLGPVLETIKPPKHRPPGPGPDAGMMAPDV